MSPSAASALPPGKACAVGPDLWYRREADGSYLLGLTDGAERRAGRVARYRGPEPGRYYRAREPAMSIESDKWVGHLALPVDGTVLDTNSALESDPSLLHRDPLGAAWLCRWKPKDPEALERLGTPVGSEGTG